MNTVSFFVRGEPVGKGRGRVCRTPAGVRVVTPGKTRTYEGIVRTMAIESMGGDPPTELPLQLELDIVCSVPASWPDWKRRMALCDQVRPTSKPDADNVLKAISDSCNGVVWRDDTQVVTLTIHKLYGETPGVQVRVTAVDALQAQIKRRP